MIGRTRIAVVGGGVVGAAVASELAAVSGVAVTLLDRGGFEAGATARSAGLVTLPAAYGHLPAVVDYGLDHLRAFDGTAGFSFRETAGLELVTPAEARGHRAHADQLASDGLDVTVLDREALVDAYPAVDGDRFACGVVYGGTGTVDPGAYRRALLSAARERGATLRDAAVTRVRVADGRVTGVETPDGRVKAEWVVAAAGWRTPDLLSATLELPIRPYRTQCVVVEAPRLEDPPTGWIPDDGVYFRPWNGGLLVGGRASPTDDPAAASRRADPAFREFAVDAVSRAFDPVEAGDSRVVDDWAGVDGATPDAYPVVDAPAEAPARLVVATGLHGRGVMSAGAVAAAVRSILTGADAPFPLDPFRLDRFDDRSSEFEV